MPLDFLLVLMHTASTITTTTRTSTNIILNTTPIITSGISSLFGCPSVGVADRDTLVPEFDREELTVLDIDDELCVEEAVNSKLLVNILVSEDDVREVCGN